MGEDTTASGDSSTAMGQGTTAKSDGEVALGLYNVEEEPASASHSNDADVVLRVGNGKPFARSDALRVYKSGKLWLKATDQTLDVAVWTDNTVAEVFFMAGRSAFAVPLPCAAVSAAAAGGGGISVFADSNEEGGVAELVGATAYAVSSIRYV